MLSIPEHTLTWRERWGWLVVFATAVMVALAVGMVGAQWGLDDLPPERVLGSGR